MKVAISWIIVAVPLLWGVSQTVIKSKDLFSPPAPVAPAAPAPAAAAPAK